MWKLKNALPQFSISKAPSPLNLPCLQLVKNTCKVETSLYLNLTKSQRIKQKLVYLDLQQVSIFVCEICTLQCIFPNLAWICQLWIKQISHTVNTDGPEAPFNRLFIPQCNIYQVK